MTKTIHLVFDGEVFRPEEPVDLAPRTRVRATIEPAAAPLAPTASFLAIAQSLELEGPPDWSSRLEDYLYES